MNTASTVLTRAGINDLPAEYDIPILSGLSRQGDVIVVPVDHGSGKTATQPVPAAGIILVAGQHEHRLMGEDVRWAPSGREGTDVGMVVARKPAYLVHTAGPDRLGEHDALGLAPGCYRVTRQREQADVQRIVAD